MLTGTDTQTLRRALRSGMNQGAGSDQATGLDVTLIMHRGRRLRRRRRLVAVAGGVCAIAVLGGVATAVAGLHGGTAWSRPAGRPRASGARHARLARAVPFARARHEPDPRPAGQGAHRATVRRRLPEPLADQDLVCRDLAGHVGGGAHPWPWDPHRRTATAVASTGPTPSATQAGSTARAGAATPTPAGTLSPSS